jgi:hypothetical protein
MTYKMGDCEIDVKGEVTNIALGTTANHAYTLWLAKQKQIADLEYECDILVDKYHAEMKRADIPLIFSKDNLLNMFSKNKKMVKFARKHFLEKGFSPDFPKEHKIEFVDYSLHGYYDTAISIKLNIGDYEYTIEFPQPWNIRDEKDKKLLMGQVKFRVDRIHKSKLKEFVKEMEPVQMPTYDWKECFMAIETIVAKDTPKEGK